MYISKIKIFIAAGVGLVVIGLLAGGFVVWNNRHDKTDQSLASSSAAGDDRPVSQNSIPLTQTGPAAPDTGGLSVTSSNAASSVSQLDGSSQKQSTGGTNSSSAGKAPDPSTFGEYEKYKTAEHALFGEMQVGNGAELTANHKAAVYYRGWLTNGQLFDQSRAGSDSKLQPFVFTMGAHQVIAGWEEALAGMKVGGVRLVIIPPVVGYGTTGQGSIPPNAVLVFQVQLAAVE